MVLIEQSNQLSQITDERLRRWLEGRMMELREAGCTVCFWIVQPDEDVLAACWSACWGQAPTAPIDAQALFDVVEYVEAQSTFFALVVPVNHEADLIVIVPTDARLDADLKQRLRQASVPLDT